VKKLLAVAAAVAGAALLFAAPASAAGQVCYDLGVNVNGDSVVAEAACHALP
jgi:hypothetical protein